MFLITWKFGLIENFNNILPANLLKIGQNSLENSHKSKSTLRKGNVWAIWA